MFPDVGCLIVDVLCSVASLVTVHRYLIEWLTYLTTRKMRRIDQESRATLQPPRHSQDIQLRPLTPVNRVISSFVEQTSYIFTPG